ncbi:hypothetical protein M2164_007495 [Streptomyces sp. SAI-208]|uniref:DUF6214 family protein n=1 Tax=unclassified Streptomyces TaxID=2593676 RepID=UPI002475E3DC|nr:MULTISPECIES: DUF6214 family protein [unclassified Streptomyces]MDH6520866.1 hypothetical protein [Streptomyces sp. SAI-090]MDH6553086.1 hypothetical protein [Streptomyces sp. SAI-041]MDH6572168.1 hypothetical protein [Streptomyces sp. SAI-117]MDH6582873.1 hypothetical protein [Streptomyces sp. SAI-133]MDH6611860.1 hypothetical protein [Streptomyces sp. SAI-208]
MSVWPAWEVREEAGATAWCNVRLVFSDGARVDALAVVAQEGVCLEDVRAAPALSLDDMGALADWIEGPVLAACGRRPEAGTDGPGPRRARPAWPRGLEGRWQVAQEYRAAQEDGVDPVLAVMCATGHSRRKSLRLISQARDAGFLTPRHARR